MNIKNCMMKEKAEKETAQKQHEEMASRIYQLLPTCISKYVVMFEFPEHKNSGLSGQGFLLPHRRTFVDSSEKYSRGQRINSLLSNMSVVD